MIFTKLFASFVVKNALNAIFGPNKSIFSVKNIFFIKEYEKNEVFRKRMGEIRRFASFYVKISQNWLKFLSFTQNFDVLHLKM